MKKNKEIIYLDQYKVAKPQNARESSISQEDFSRYACYYSGDRLRGEYQVLFHDTWNHHLEVFFLDASYEGFKKHILVRNRADIEYLLLDDYQSVTYIQAIGLLGDAIRQSYKHQQGNEKLEGIRSVHIHQVWHELYEKHDLQWLLQGYGLDEVTQLYLLALGRKDSSLLYDLMDQNNRNGENRGYYTHHWYHDLEDVWVDYYDLVEYLEHPDSVEMFLILYVRNHLHQLLEVDLSLHLSRQDGCVRILRETIREARVR